MNERPTTGCAPALSPIPLLTQRLQTSSRQKNTPALRTANLAGVMTLALGGLLGTAQVQAQSSVAAPIPMNSTAQALAGAATLAPEPKRCTLPVGSIGLGQYCPPPISTASSTLSTPTAAAQGSSAGTQAAPPPQPSPPFLPTRSASAVPVAPASTPASTPTATAAAISAAPSASSGSSSGPGSPPASLSAIPPASSASAHSAADVPATVASALASGTPPKPQAAHPASAQQWELRISDLTLANALARWAQQAQWRVRWDASKHVLIEAPDVLYGSFENVLQTVLSSPGIAHSSYPLEVCFYPNTPPLARITRKGEQDQECQP